MKNRGFVETSMYSLSRVRRYAEEPFRWMCSSYYGFSLKRRKFLLMMMDVLLIMAGTWFVYVRSSNKMFDGYVIIRHHRIMRNFNLPKTTCRYSNVRRIEFQPLECDFVFIDNCFFFAISKKLYSYTMERLIRFDFGIKTNVILRNG